MHQYRILPDSKGQLYIKVNERRHTKNRQTDGTGSITLIADAGGNKRPINELCLSGAFKGYREI